MLIKVHFHKDLYNKTGVTEQNFEVEDLLSLFNGIKTIFPELGKHFNAEMQNRIIDTIAFIKKDKTLVGESEYMRNNLNDSMSEIWVVPSLTGSGAGAGAGAGTAAGAAGSAVVSAGVANAIVTALIRALVGIAINLALSVIISLLSPKRGKQEDGTVDNPTRVDNNIFLSIQNTLTVDTPIFLIYGSHRAGGHLISGRVTVIDHGKNDFINIADYV